MTRAIPALFPLVPVHDALQMRAGGGAFVDVAIRVAIGGDLVQAAAENGAGVVGDVIGGFHFAGRDPVAILNSDVEVFLRVLGRGAVRLARWVVDFGPRILFAVDEI